MFYPTHSHIYISSHNFYYFFSLHSSPVASIVEDNRLVRNHHEVTEEFFNERVKEWVKHYNYSLNPDGAYDAIKWMYTYGPDPHNVTHIREEYVNVSVSC